MLIASLIRRLPKLADPGSYLCRGPLDQNVSASVYFAIENGPPRGRPCYG